MRMNILKNKIASLLAIPMLAISFMLFAPSAPSVGALTVCSDGTTVEDGAKCAEPEGVPGCLFGDGCAFTNIINTLLYVIGAVSVLMIIYGGIRYTISGGNEKDVLAAKNTIMYAIIGVIVALLAFAIVNFVLTRLT
jgi:hypothetical protein